MDTINQKELTVADGCSDGRKLLAEEVPEPQSMAFTSGYTIDDRGLLNNYAILPPMYVEEPTKPTMEEQFRSKAQMIFAMLIIATAMLIALVVS